LLSKSHLILSKPCSNCIFVDLLVNFKTEAATAVAHAAVPQALVNPAPRSHTFILICVSFFISANVTLHLSGK